MNIRVKAAVILFLSFMLFVNPCMALTLNSRGYHWRDATEEDKIKLCKSISREFGKNYIHWYKRLEDYFATSDPNVVGKRLLNVIREMLGIGIPPVQLQEHLKKYEQERKEDDEKLYRLF